MLSTKKDYRFLSEKALKYISINGSPYPIRKAKRLIIGEDWAWLKEAIQERVSIAYASAVEVYDTIIRTVDRVIDYTFYEALQRFFTARNFFYTKSLENLPYAPTNDNILELTSSYLSSTDPSIPSSAKDYNYHLEAFNEAVEDRDEAISTAFDIYTAAMEDLEKEKEESLKSIGTERAVSRTAESERHIAKQDSLSIERKEKKENEDKVYNDAISTLTQKYANEDDPYEKLVISQDMKKEEVRHAKEKEKIEVDYYQSWHDEDELTDYNNAIINEKYTTAKNKIEDNYDEQCKIFKKAYNDARKSAKETCYAKGYTHCVYGYWPIDIPGETEYTTQKEKAEITTSCAHKWFERDPKYKMSSTSLNRIFGDLERMTTVASGYYFYRLPYETDSTCHEPWFNPGDHIYYDAAYPMDSSDFGIYVGTRDNHNLITEVYADFLIKRYGWAYSAKNAYKKPFVEWEPNKYYTAKKGDHGTLLHYSGYVPYPSGITTEYVDWYMKVTYDHKSGNYPGTTEGPFNAELVTENYYTSVYDQKTSYFIHRVYFSKADSGSAMITALDECDDIYYTQRDGIVENCDAQLLESEKKHNAIIKEAQAKRDKLIEEAEEELEKKYAAIQIEFVTAANSIDTNDAIKDTDDDDDKQKILNNWITGTYASANESRQEKRNSAYDTYSKTLAQINDAYNEEVESENERYAKEQKAIEKERDKNLSDLEEKWIKQHNDITDEYRDNLIEAAKDEYNDKLNKAYAEYKDTCSKAYYEFYSTCEKGTKENPSIFDQIRPHKPAEWNPELPLTDEEISFLDDDSATKYYLAQSNYDAELFFASAYYDTEKQEATKQRSQKVKDIPPSNQDHRDLWKGTPSVLGDDGPKPGKGLDSNNSCTIERILGIYVTYEPKSLTGENFSAYYDELDEEQRKQEEETGE